MGAAPYSDFLSGLGEDFGLEDADVGKVAVGPGVIEAVAYYELVRHLEAQVLHVEVDPPA